MKKVSKWILIGCLALLPPAAHAQTYAPGQKARHSAIPYAPPPANIGVPGYVAAPGSMAVQATGNTNGYFQISIQNLSSGSSASSDYVATANDGNDSIHYADFGINGSGGGAAPFTAAHAAYVYSVDSELDLGATGASGVVNFYTTGGSSPVKAGFFDASQVLNLTHGVTAGGVGAIGTVSLLGNTSGTVLLTPQAAAGTPTVTFGTSSGTPAVTSSSPLAITTATGNITCATCATTTNGGALTATSPMAISAGGVISINASVGGTYLGDSVATAQTIVLVQYAPYAMTINTLKNLGTVSGTVTAALQINGVAVTGCTALSLTSTPAASTTCSAANTVAAGDKITFVTSSPSSLTGLLAFSMIATRS